MAEVDTRSGCTTFSSRMSVMVPWEINTVVGTLFSSVLEDYSSFQISIYMCSVSAVGDHTHVSETRTISRTHHSSRDSQVELITAQEIESSRTHHSSRD